MTDQAANAPGPDWFWSDYWRTGQQACCFNMGGDNYGPQIVKVWSEFFEKLPADAKILDLCTGNGAIAILATELGQRRNAQFEVHGVDRAEIYVEKTRLFSPGVHGKVRFQSGVATEALPFEDASFDSIVSQYGIEYTDLTRTIPEVARVTKPGGQLRFIVHARDGAVLTAAEGQLAGAQFLDEMGIIGALRAFVTRAAVVDQAGENATEEQRQAASEVAAHLQTLMKSLDDGIRLLNAPVFLQQVRQSLVDILSKRRSVGPEAATAKVDELERSVEGHRRRIAAMTKASLDERGIRAFSAQFESAGFTAEPAKPLRISDGRLYGWQFDAKK
jgi:ubiquinone/menaquinone biosynthesis C-methylase UbiE